MIPRRRREQSTAWEIAVCGKPMQPSGVKTRRIRIHERKWWEEQDSFVSLPPRLTSSLLCLNCAVPLHFVRRVSLCHGIPELFYCFPNNLLAYATGIDVGGVPGGNPYRFSQSWKPSMSSLSYFSYLYPILF